MAETAVMSPDAVVNADALDVGDTIRCDYLPIRWFDSGIIDQRSGTIKRLRGVSGQPVAIGTGPAVTDRPGLIISVIPVTEPTSQPSNTVHVLASANPLVETLRQNLSPGHCILLIKPTGTSRIDVSVKTPDNLAITRLTTATPETVTAAADALVGETPVRFLIDVSREPDLDPYIQEAISRLIVGIVIE